MPPLFTPIAERRELPHGQGLITYTERNYRYLEDIGGHEAPDPIRQTDVAHRPAKMPIVLMSLRPADWDSGFANDFIPYAKVLTRRLQRAGRQTETRAQNTFGDRPNIQKPAAVAYGSMFTME